MIIDLAGLGNSPHSFEFSLAPEEIILDDETAKLKNAVRVAGTLTKHIAQVDVEGRIRAQTEIECARCLRTFEHKLDFPFAETFVTEENYTAAKEVELHGEDLDVSVFEGDKIDLDEIVREQILLNLPEQIFCAEDCKGFCEKCGANRNLINCNCIEKEVDPRWSALKNLK
ncbi:MAG: YceD family protein [Pyrinomonadaceae bacterium]